jgi:hypothetical protein
LIQAVLYFFSKVFKRNNVALFLRFLTVHASGFRKLFAVEPQSLVFINAVYSRGSVGTAANKLPPSDDENFTTLLAFLRGLIVFNP